MRDKKEMIIKLKSGDSYNTDLHPTLQNLSVDGIREVMELFKNQMKG